MWHPTRQTSRCTVEVGRHNCAALSLLVPEEREEYDALRCDDRRRDWLAGRVAAKRAVAGRLGTHRLDTIRLVARDGSSPAVYLRGRNASWHELPIAVSIAHRAGLGLAAAADRQVLVGVDVERAGAVPGAHRRFFLSPHETPSLAALDATTLWVLKEAAWKALALTDEVAFHDLELHGDGEAAVRAVSVRGLTLPVHAMVWQPSHNLIAAVLCAAGEVS